MALTRTALLFVLLLFWGHHASADTFAARAWELYVAANYEEALDALAAIESDATTSETQRILLEYRALCLLALEQPANAWRVLEEMVDADPFYVPSTDTRPPRFIDAFSDVRGRRLPAIARDHYVRATAAFDEQRYADARELLSYVLRLLSTADSTGSPTDAETRALLESRASRFLDILATYERLNDASTSQPAPGGSAWESLDANVVPAVPLEERIPQWPESNLGNTPYDGAIEVLIDTQGNVSDVRLTSGVHPTYDPVLLEAARAWKYRPATKDGRPVASRRAIEIRVMPQRRIAPTGR